MAEFILDKLTEWKTLWEMEKMLVTSIFSFSRRFQKVRSSSGVITNFNFSIIFISLSVHAFNLDQFKNLSWGRELTNIRSRLLTTVRKKPFENIMGKEENAGTQHFLLFPQCFLLYYREKSSF